MKIYRSNNQKIRNIYETSRVTGKQQEYVDFLVDLNKNIAKSFENTLPKDSAWMKQFKDLNADYRQYKSALKTMNELKPILEERATPSSIQKLAGDMKKQKQLQTVMGQKGADEVIQIAKDLRDATESIKRMQVKKFSPWENIMPFGVLIPGIKIPASYYGAKKGLGALQRGYGWYLSSAQRRAAYNQALKAISNNDLKAYEKAVKTILRLRKSEDEED